MSSFIGGGGGGSGGGSGVERDTVVSFGADGGIINGTVPYQFVRSNLGLLAPADAPAAQGYLVLTAVTLDRLAWSTQAGDATTMVQLINFDTSTVMRSITLTGAVGVVSFPALSLSANLTLRLRISAGTNPNGGVYALRARTTDDPVSGFGFSFGGDVTLANTRLTCQEPAFGTAIAADDPTNQFPNPLSGVQLTGIAYRTELGDATSEWIVLRNGATVATVTQTAANGVTAFGAAVTINAGDRLRVQHNAGALTGNTSLYLFGA